MRIVLQYPFADFRPFLQGETARLSEPQWPFPEPGRDFVRQSGAVRRRRRGGLAQWTGEEFYSHATRAVRFRQDLRRQMVDGGRVFGNKGVSRRFHVCGAVARFELAMSAQPSGHESPLSLLDSILALRIAVPDETGFAKPTRLGEAKTRLAQLYLRATTQRKAGLRQPVEHWWLEPGEPLCVMAFREDEISSASIRSNPSRDLGGSKVSFAWVEVRQQLIGLWLIATDYPDGDHARALRLHLLRLHAERECLKRVLANLGSRLSIEAGTDGSDRLEAYLDDGLALLDKRKRFGFEQSPLLDAVTDSFAIVQSDSSTGLARELDKARSSVARKTERFLLSRTNQAAVVNIVRGSQTIERIDMRSINFGGDVTVSGDFNAVVADQIENSFNRVAGSDTRAELKAALQELVIEAAKVTKLLPAEKAEEAARDLEILTKEATAPKPRAKWYQISAEGLLEAAKAVGEAAKPFVEIIGKVLLLLG